MFLLSSEYAAALSESVFENYLNNYTDGIQRSILVRALDDGEGHLPYANYTVIQ